MKDLTFNDMKFQMQKKNCSFEDLRALVVCIFKRLAENGVGLNWTSRNTVEQNIDTYIEILKTTVMQMKSGYDTDLVAFQLPGELFRDKRTAEKTLHCIFHKIEKRMDMSEGQLFENKDSDEWRFTLLKKTFFVSCFAPFYQTEHCRWSGSEHVAWLLFQPTTSFKYILDTVEKRESAALKIKDAANRRNVFIPKGLTEYEKLLMPDRYENALSR